MDIEMVYADTLSSVVRANDADFIVQETFDLDDVTPGDGLCTNSYGTCSLRAAITEANALLGTQSIYILPGTYFIRQGRADDTNVSGDFDITDDLVLTGYGMNQTSIKEAVNIGSFERFFDVDPLQTGLTVTIANLSLYSVDVGGDNGTGFRNNGNLTLENIDISNSVGDSMIYNAGTININHSRFGDNIIRNTIFNDTTGNMTIRNSLITRNTARNNNGAGLLNNGTILVENSTISYNKASNPGGGILNNGGNMVLNFVTLFGNRGSSQSASEFGGGFYNANGTMTIGNTIITGNVVGSYNTVVNCTASLGTTTLSTGYNVFGDGGCPITGETSTNIVLPDTTSVLLDTQGNYGGGNETISLLLGSPAIDAANPAACPSTDQRGVTRPAACDVGAFERVSDSTLYPPTITAVEINGINIEPQNLYPETTSQIAITFSENVINPVGNSEPDDVTNPTNYRVFSAGVNERIDSLICDVPQSDDVAIAIDAVSYDAANHRATLTLNNGAALANGIYALFVCGTTSIVDSDGNLLDGVAEDASSI
ncbi:MAG: choice-of-anchor Q domain-containing protein [Anaerolineae bacterium]|nr:choice-of-anchor Q domain-containing protein [Anaerolineae bacterium]MDQ7036755.1 choice-of-anchor Q domain-containing protein [Anaerolineae bacterium]